MSVIRLTTTAGAREPVSVQDLRAFARVVSDDENHGLESLLLAARQEVERYSGHVLVPGTFRVALDTWDVRMELPLLPVREITSVAYQYTDGTTPAVEADLYYADLGATPPRLVFLSPYSRPSALRSTAGIEIEVVAGYASHADVPWDIKQHVLTLALLMYEHRDDPDVLPKVRRYAAEGAGAFAVVTL